MAFESGVFPEDLRSAVIVLLHKGKGEMIKCKSYRGISLLSVVDKVYAGILVVRLIMSKGVLEQGEGIRSYLHPKADR